MPVFPLTQAPAHTRRETGPQQTRTNQAEQIQQNTNYHCLDMSEHCCFSTSSGQQLGLEACYNFSAFLWALPTDESNAETILGIGWGACFCAASFCLCLF